MSFNTGLSGLRAANTDLAVTGNNIANASTTGFKTSRAEFGDVYASSLVSSGSVPGSGVLVSSVSQQFDQGNIAFTDNSLDLAINGDGFFIMATTAGDIVYTRAGNFGLDDEGFIVSNDGSILQGFAADDDGGLIQVPADLQVSTTSLDPNATTELDMDFNLNSTLTSPYAETNTGPFTAFNVNDSDTYNSTTSQTIYDEQGNPHVMTQYFAKQWPDTTADAFNTGVLNAWDVYVYIDGEAVTDTVNNPLASAASAGPTFAPAYSIGFTTAGALDTGYGTGIFEVTNWVPKDANGDINGSTSGTITLDFSGATQNSGEFSQTSTVQNGFAPGRLTGVDISADGTLFARYSNGEAKTLGNVLLATFSNSQGLSPQGSTTWAQSADSGEPVVGTPQTGSLGSLQAGALEESNVDLSEQLVQLIIAQRNFQANSKTIETANTVTQNILNLR